ncbi:velvet factor-domain-containing protein [Lyophyllum atratum]|nr:velvet factor-domain-containing protein [Lyophyllum atratum]
MDTQPNTRIIQKLQTDSELTCLKSVIDVRILPQATPFRMVYLSQYAGHVDVAASQRTYHLEIIQHPQKTAEFGHSSLSRLPLTPPIIARLTVRDSSGNSVVPEAELPFLIAHLSLFSDDGLTALDMGSSIGRGHTPPLLYGNLVSSIDQLEDLQGNMGLFFVFPDVSIRWRGRFQLGIAVMRISRSDPSGGMGIADQGMVLAEARTRSFDVLPYPQYTAVRM